jgi:hypothetical protein
MTLCELITKPIKRLVEEEGRNLEEIAEEICPKVKYGKEKIIRIIRDFLGEEYLIQHAETLKYDVGKAQLAKKRKTTSHKKIDATIDSVIESNTVTPIASCQTVNTEHSETGQTKGQDEVVEYDTSAACCQERKKIVSEKRDSEEETKEQVLKESNAAPEINEFNELVGEIKRLINIFTLDLVKRALALAESEV